MCFVGAGVIDVFLVQVVQRLLGTRGLYFDNQGKKLEDTEIRVLSICTIQLPPPLCSLLTYTHNYDRPRFLIIYRIRNGRSSCSYSTLAELISEISGNETQSPGCHHQFRVFRACESQPEPSVPFLSNHNPAERSTISTSFAAPLSYVYKDNHRPSSEYIHRLPLL
jgi:hypothetical protein